MQDSVFQVLFLGENCAWAKLSQSFHLGDDLRVQRLDSLADLFRSLTEGRWHALAIDVNAWNFQGLHYVDKVRSEYPSFPIVAIHSGSELDKKAQICGASQCIGLHELTADTLHAAVASSLAAAKSKFLLQKSAEKMMEPSASVAMTFSKNQVITHALNNLLCVIAANAELLSDKLAAAADGPSLRLEADVRPLTEIKKAAKSAAALMRHLK
jgi:hypothetical protein